MNKFISEQLFKMKIAFLGIMLCLVQNIFANCPNKKLSCFDSRDYKLGEITVTQCWSTWEYSCLPCKAETKGRDIRKKIFDRYLPNCRYHFPKSIKVHGTKNAMTNKAIGILSKKVHG